MNKSFLLAAALFGSAVAAPAFAASVLTEKNISLEYAERLAQKAIESCSAKNYSVAVTVVDRGGVIKVLKRMDNAGPHTVEASRMKAFTALSTKSVTGDVMKNAQENAGAQNLRDIPGFLLLAGGVPVKVDNQTIGAIGIGGAPGGHLDQQCATEALEDTKSLLNAS
jgi:uncharacterized protein GlcG (DUF336 family)